MCNILSDVYCYWIGNIQFFGFFVLDNFFWTTSNCHVLNCWFCEEKHIWHSIDFNIQYLFTGRLKSEIDIGCKHAVDQKFFTYQTRCIIASSKFYTKCGFDRWLHLQFFEILGKIRVIEFENMYCTVFSIYMKVKRQSTEVITYTVIDPRDSTQPRD